MNLLRILSRAVLVLPVSGLFACASAYDGAEPERVGAAAAAAVADITCVNRPYPSFVDPPVDVDNCAWTVGSLCNALSPNGNYNTANGDTCHHQFAVNFNYTPQGHRLSFPLRSWSGQQALDPTLCPNAHMAYTAWYFDTNDSMFHYIGYTQATGSWEGAFKGCVFHYDSGYSALPTHTSTSTQHQVEVATQSWIESGFGPVYDTARAWIHVDN